MLNNRIPFLLDDYRKQRLSRIAKDQNKSIGELIRSAVDKIYFNSQDEKMSSRSKAFERIKARGPIARKLTLKDYKEMINHGRKW